MKQPRRKRIGERKKGKDKAKQKPLRNKQASINRVEIEIARAWL